ncbi:GyrI-like domain-containing protein [Saccharothrix mutabilis subsp. mutabilis]|uniref:GyrI-like domain-containing protein n=1 Tax=Saccharothrix mutabilis subsp. mutabilis TaxID=66855 RepID=A0ABN0UEG3_9PSEU
MRTHEIRTRTRTEQPTAVATATLSVPEIGPWLGRTYAAVAAALNAQGLRPVGPPFARYHVLGGGRHEVEAGFPTSAPVAPAGEVRPSALPGGEAAETVHTGPYDEMEPAYAALAAWVRDQGGELAGDAWEVYLSDPNTQPDPATWRTGIVQPYRPAV